MMFGLHFTGEVPFRRILLHGLVVDETGEKMSKVKGNVIDPLALVSGSSFTEMLANTMPGVPEAEAIAKFKKAYPSAAGMGDGFPAFGADAVRFTLATYPPSNKRIALAPRRIEGNRHFLNKIWNATRLALDLLGQDFVWRDDAPAPQGFYNRWIRSRFAVACAAAHDGLDTFRIDEAALASYRFFWNDLCDWYLELAKPILREGPDGAFLHPAIVPETRATLAYVLEGSLRLLHPLMPFITEELWHRVPRPASARESLAFGPFPTRDDERASLDPSTEAWMDLLKAVISAGRTIRSEHDLEKAEILVAIRSASPEVLVFLRGHADAIRSLLRTEGPPVFEAAGGPRAPGTAVGMVASMQGPIEVLVPLKGLVTADAEKARIDRNLKKIGKDLGALEKKLGSPGFVDRAPKEVVDEARQQRESLLEAKARLEATRDLARELE
jgi:valyl-tRNA synthetase